MAENAVEDTQLPEGVYNFYRDMSDMGKVISELTVEMHTRLTVVDLTQENKILPVAIPESVAEDITRMWASRLMSFLDVEQ